MEKLQCGEPPSAGVIGPEVGEPGRKMVKLDHKFNAVHSYWRNRGYSTPANEPSIKSAIVLPGKSGPSATAFITPPPPKSKPSATVFITPPPPMSKPSATVSIPPPPPFFLDNSAAQQSPEDTDIKTTTSMEEEYEPIMPPKEFLDKVELNKDTKDKMPDDLHKLQEYQKLAVDKIKYWSKYLGEVNEKIKQMREKKVEKLETEVAALKDEIGKLKEEKILEMTPGYWLDVMDDL